MKKGKNLNNENKTILTEEMLSQNIAKSNEEFLNSIEHFDDVEKKSKFSFIKKKPFIIGSFIFVILLLCLIGFILLGNSISEETLASNFSITSIEPKTKGNYISNNETFIVKTSAANEDIIRNHLYIEPAVNYDIKKINSKEYEVSLSNVPSDTIVNLSLVKNEVKSYSWAFQSTKDLKVLSIYPANGASTVQTNSGVSVVLSYPNVENFEEHFEISPKVEGQFVQNGRAWKFIPSKELENDTNYTITITKGLKAGDYELEENISSTFSTYNRPQNIQTNYEENNRMYLHSSISVDHINSFTINEPIIFKMY